MQKQSFKTIFAGVIVVCLALSCVTYAEDMVELKIDLPKAMFAGTPKKLKSDNLDTANIGKMRKAFLVPKGTKNVAAGKKVISSDSYPIIGELDLVTDGDKEAADGCYVELAPGKQYVQIDLEASYGIYAILIWHYHSEACVYRDVVVQVSNDPDFIKNVKTVFNNDHNNSSGLGAGKDKEWIETNEGKLIDTKGIKARYIRLYSNGCTSSDMNHYTEVEVYGKPAK
ncbi:hypothetical protein ACFLS1_07895 [Verrucomicrobiota bacterium]